MIGGPPDSPLFPYPTLFRCGVLEIARQNLKDPPRRYTEIALEQLPGILSFFEKDVPAAFKEAKDEATLREFSQANQQVLDRKSTRLNSSYSQISYAVFSLKK